MILGHDVIKELSGEREGQFMFASESIQVFDCCVCLIMMDESINQAITLLEYESIDSIILPLTFLFCLVDGGVRMFTFFPSKKKQMSERIRKGKNSFFRFLLLLNGIHWNSNHVCFLVCFG